MEDYTAPANSKKSKAGAEGAEPSVSKDIEPVVIVPVVMKKQGIGGTFKALFIEADIPSVTQYVFMDVLVPAAKNMMFDAIKEGAGRLFYGQNRSPNRSNFGPGGRFTYDYNQGPIHRPYRDPRGALPGPSRAPEPYPGPRMARYARDEFVISSREEADTVLERMHEIIENYEAVSVGDLNELVGLPSTHVDQKYGWTSMVGAQVRQIREGFLLDLPPAQPI